jgi:hypothetical protein
MFDITTFLQSIGPATEIAKRMESPEEKHGLLDALFQARLLVVENTELRARVEDLEGKLRFKQTIRFERNAFWSDNPEDPGPFCGPCWDGKRLGVHLIDVDGARRSFACKFCGKTFEVSPRKIDWQSMNLGLPD